MWSLVPIAGSKDGNMLHTASRRFYSTWQMSSINSPLATFVTRHRFESFNPTRRGGIGLYTNLILRFHPPAGGSSAARGGPSMILSPPQCPLREA
ncbi:MAG: hypothetical protein O2856_11355 [Planctomycetota bacterium]|nr:hypothetical protein [Planctomycetota bacterium]